MFFNLSQKLKVQKKPNHTCNKIDFFAKENIKKSYKIIFIFNNIKALKY